VSRFVSGGSFSRPLLLRHAGHSSPLHRRLATPLLAHHELERRVRRVACLRQPAIDTQLELNTLSLKLLMPDLKPTTNGALVVITFTLYCATANVRNRESNGGVNRFPYADALDLWGQYVHPRGFPLRVYGRRSLSRSRATSEP